ncbi:MAG: N-acetyl sugar amidotransferase [Candidatus Omnitrophica bacterium]|nr:N-acetyl sugar amidotransferase [Candidatus Omnitrophota bacterium]
MKLCSKCVIPETHETIAFDEKGVCNVCRQIEHKQENVDWDARGREFEKIINLHRNKGQYDCIVPFSGGKDSTYTLYKVVKDYKLKPLVVSFDHGFFRPNLLANVERTMQRLGCDYLKFKANPKVVKKIMFEALTRKGDFCWHCHVGVVTYPLQIAIKFKIPLVIWGEQSTEYASYTDYDQMEEVNEKLTNQFVNLGITAEDMVGMLDDTVTMRDLEPFRFPPLKELRALNYSSIPLGYFIPWDVKKHVEIIKKELGWRGDAVEGVPPEYDYEKIECAFQGIRDYCKFIKRGYARVSHLTSIDIRNHRLKREEAEKLIKEYEGKRPASLDIFLKYVGITEKEFNDMLIKHAISPYNHDFENTQTGQPLKDMPEWTLAQT